MLSQGGCGAMRFKGVRCVMCCCQLQMACLLDSVLI